MTWRETIDAAGEAPYTDLGNRDRFVARHGKDLRYCRGIGWLAWNGVRWELHAEHLATERAAETVRAMLRDAVAQPASADRKKLIGHALKSESENAIRAMVKLAKSHPAIRVLLDDLDADPWILNATNGTIDLKTGTLREHRREDYCTRLAPVTYDPAAEAPLWLRFLEQVQPDPDVRGFLQRFAGYAATGSTREQVFALHHGGGANGKTVYESCLRAVLGDYAAVTPFDTFLVRRRGAATNDLAALRGARLVVASEPEEDCRLGEEVIKRVTGGDEIAARFLYKELFTFRPAAKILLSGNHRPAIRGTDFAIWRRVLLVPWAVTIAEPDKDLGDKLQAEAAGILAWIVAGCVQWKHDGLRAPAVVRAAVAEYREAEDHVGNFITDRCWLGDGLSITSKALRAAYVTWCEAEGEEPLTPQAVGPKLTARGLRAARIGGKSARGWKGIALADALGRPVDKVPHTRARGQFPPSDSPGVRRSVDDGDAGQLPDPFEPDPADPADVEGIEDARLERAELLIEDTRP